MIFQPFATKGFDMRIVTKILQVQFVVPDSFIVAESLTKNTIARVLEDGLKDEGAMAVTVTFPTKDELHAL